jgi:hypothetical protein
MNNSKSTNHSNNHTMKLKLKLSLTAALAGLFLAALLPGARAQNTNGIGINFVNSSLGGVDNTAADAMLPDDSAGPSPYTQANWNNLSRSGAVSVVTNSAGTAVPLVVNWDGPWSDSSGTLGLGTGDGKLMDGFLQPGWSGSSVPVGTNVYNTSQSDKPLIYVGGLNSWCAGIGVSGYTIVVYAAGYTWWGEGEHWIQAVSGDPLAGTMVSGADLTPHQFRVGNASFSGTFAQVSPTATNDAARAYNANYMVFAGLTNDAVLIRNSPLGWGGDCINGFQIIPISAVPPTPGTPTFSPSSTVFAGVPVTVTEVAIGDPLHPQLWYQWLKDNGDGLPIHPITDATNSTYNFTPANAASTYTITFAVAVSNIFGVATSTPAMLTVNPAVPPYVVSDTSPGPGNGSSNVYAFANGQVTFNASFDGPSPITYQWQDDTNSGYGSILNATNTSVTVSNQQLTDSGNYRLAANNSYGTSFSTPAPLTVLADPPAPAPSEAYAYMIYTNNPVAYWRFSETLDNTTNSVQAYDYSGHNFNGTYGHGVGMGSAVTGPQSPGFPGFEADNLAASFLNNYANGVITVPSILNLNTNAATISMWIQPGLNEGAYWGLFTWANGSDKAAFGFGPNVNSAGMAELGYTWNTNSADTYNWHSGLYPQPNQWSLVTLVVTPTNATIYMYYVDPNTGNIMPLKATNAMAHGIETFNGGNIRIGSDTYDGRNFNGLIDELAVFNRALSETEVQGLYLTALGVAGAPPVITTNPAPSVNLCGGQSFQITADGAGAPWPNYYWQAGAIGSGVFHNLTDGGRISGAHTSSLAFSSLSGTDTLDYRLVLSNAFGTATSSVCTLTVPSVPAGLWTANFQVTNNVNGTWGLWGSGSFAGHGPLGSGTYWNVVPFNNGPWGYCYVSSLSDLMDDGVTSSGVTCTIQGNGVGGASAPYAHSDILGLMTQHANINAVSTNPVVNMVQFSGLPNGTYNLAIIGINGPWNDRGGTFTVHAANGDQSGSLVNAQDQYLVLGDNTLIFTGVGVSGGWLGVDAYGTEVLPPPPATPKYTNNNEVDLNAVQLQLVQAKGNPAHISALNVSGGNVTMSGTCPDAGQTYRILCSTNVAAPLASWTPIATNTFPGGAFSDIIPANPAQPQLFYRIVEP